MHALRICSLVILPHFTGMSSVLPQGYQSGVAMYWQLLHPKGTCGVMLNWQPVLQCSALAKPTQHALLQRRKHCASCGTMDFVIPDCRQGSLYLCVCAEVYCDGVPLAHAALVQLLRVLFNKADTVLLRHETPWLLPACVQLPQAAPSKFKFVWMLLGRDRACLQRH